MIHGRVTGISRDDLGDEASAAALTGATSITVDDGSDFDEDGGHVLINGEVYAYTGMEYVGDAADEGDPAVLTLATGLLADVAEGDRVDVWDATLGEVAVEYVATLSSDSADVAGDVLEADVDHRLVPMLAEGIRATGAESVELERDGDDLRVVRPLGKTAAIDGAAVVNPLAMGYRITNQAIPDDTAYHTVMWAVLESEDITYDSGTGKFTVHADGIYDFRFGVKFANAGGGGGARGVQPVFETFLGTVIGREVRIPALAATAVETSQLKNLLSGERIYFQAFQNSGASLDLLAGDTTVSVMRVAAP
jgi:hypothetical protein